MMKILFDSHALVWYLRGDKRLPARMRELIDDDSVEAFVSAVCAWEMASKVRRGKWLEASEIAHSIEQVTSTMEFTPLPISVRHAQIAGLLPGRHRDPFDRMLAAQAQVEGLPLLTADPAFDDFGIQVLW
jgi:PIN domain nuclease of toxin-antitoxin system